MNTTSSKLRIIVAQLDFMVGDIAGNTQKITRAIQQARDELKGDLLVFPELALVGYPPEDLLLRPDFIQAADVALASIAAEVHGIDVILGFPEHTSKGIYNAATLLREGQRITTYRKRHLPNYSVFDEERYFIAGESTCVTTIKGLPVGIIICEDLWFPDPVAETVAAGAKLLLCINASPFDVDKFSERESLLRQRGTQNKVPIIYAQTVGAQDELIFDGGSLAIDKQGEICAQAPMFEEHLFPIDIQIKPEVKILPSLLPVALTREMLAYQALVLGLRDYVKKNNFHRVILGLSGGIDSALTLAIAVDALGADNVHALVMPSRHTSTLSLTLAETQAKLLGVKHTLITIESVFQAFLDSLAEEFAGKITDTTEENLQARCRGTLLMAMSNKLGSLVLNTSNKSELAVGYGTLYGDMVGGFAVLKDVWKTNVFQLAAYRNTLSPAIPQAVIERAPTAELAPNQTDQDSLPPYAVLDGILERYIEHNASISDIVNAGYSEDIVRHVVKLVKRSEYKRRQAPLGIKITRRAFGCDWRYPVTEKSADKS